MLAPKQRARALVYEKYKGDFRIRWFGPLGEAESGVQYYKRERATIVAISCAPEKVEQDYGGPRIFQTRTL